LETRKVTLTALGGTSSAPRGEADNIHLQLDSIGVLRHGPNNGILNFAVMKVDADFVTDLKLALWVLGQWSYSTTSICRVIDPWPLPQKCAHFPTKCPTCVGVKDTSESFPFLISSDLMFISESLKP
jgi:hypothetical protein